MPHTAEEPPVTALATDLAPPVHLPRSEQRRLLASTPPPTRSLVPNEVEDLAVRKVMYDHPLTVRRLDDPTRTSSDLPDPHLGAIRLFDRGIIALHSYTDTHAAWTWAGLNAQADGLRLLRHRTLGFLPYNMGYRGKTPATMTGPELVALLAWHYRHTTVTRLDLSVASPTAMHLVEHHTDGAITGRGFTPLFALGPFENYTRHIHPHLDQPDKALDPPVLDAVLTNLGRRVARAAFEEPALTVDLNTWHLHRYGTGPATFTETLPLDVQDALGVLDAPTFDTVEEFTGWTEEHLIVTVICRTGNETDRRRGGRKHTLRLNPHTGTATTVPSGNLRQHEELEGVHLLAALSGDPDMRCVRVGRAWTSTGKVTDTDKVRWTQTQKDRVLACHRVAEAVRHLPPRA